MPEEDEQTEVERPIATQIEERALEALRDDTAFDQACLDRLASLVASGRLSRVQEVMRALDDGPEP